MYENFVYNELASKDKIKYWRTIAKTEIDFVIENNDLVPIEVKTTPKITRALRSFIKSYGSSLALVICLNKIKKDKIGDCDVFFLPFVCL